MERIFIGIVMFIAGTLAVFNILPSNDAIIISSIWIVGAIIVVGQRK